MEIGPIAGIRAIPSMPVKGNGIDLHEVFEVADSSRSGDETYNGNAKQPTGGQDDEETELDGETLGDSSDESSGNRGRVQINFFA